MDRLADWLALVDAAYPEHDAEGWDRTGLQLGDPDDEVRGVLVCLDVVQATIAEAQARGANVILAHHPLLFRALERVTPATAPGKLVLLAARAGIAILAAHTNLDVAVPGTSDPVVDALALVDVRPLVARRVPEQVKLVTFVPPEHTAAVLAALADAGAGVIGEYDTCSFRVAGTGTFRPSAAATPAVGERERLNEVAEERLEIVVPRERLQPVVRALVAAHPYEEVAYDVYPLVAGPSAKGLGRVGDLPSALPLHAVADRLARALPSPHLRVVGDLDATVRRVAACGGAGESLVQSARASGADVYVTGDLRHHVALDAATLGLALVDAGHYATETPALAGFVSALEQRARERGLKARLLPSSVRTEPWADYRAPADARDASGDARAPDAAERKAPG